MNNYYVYKHTFPNNKVYIGITCQNPKYRWRSDGSGYKPKKNNSCKVWNAIQKYGWENVKHEILYANLTKIEAELKEIELIQYFHSQDEKYGYNIANGGRTSCHSSETRIKISNSKKGKNYGRTGENAPMFGKSHSIETKFQIGKSVSGEKNPFYGCHHTDETKDKLRKAHSCKSINQLDEYGKVINTFSSIHQASLLTGINRQGISFCLSGKYKTAGKYKWVYTTKSK